MSTHVDKFWLIPVLIMSTVVDDLMEKPLSAAESKKLRKRAKSSGYGGPLHHREIARACARFFKRRGLKPERTRENYE
jgi:hypothetical protein